MGIILTNTNIRKPIIISEIDLLIENQPVFVENEILEYAGVRLAINKGFLSEAYADECPGSVIDCSSTKVERDARIHEKAKKIKTEQKQRMLEDEANKKALKYGGGLIHGKRFVRDVSVKCKFGYGIAILDIDMPSKDDETCTDYLFEVAYADDFLDFAKEYDVFITAWKEEDCYQVWFVDLKHYIECVHVDTLETDFLNVHSDKNVKKIFKKFKKICMDKHGMDIPDITPGWMMHLYYD